MKRKSRVYAHRGPGVNPRTGEMLRPWQEVQKLDPDLKPLLEMLVAVEVVNEEAPRYQEIRVRFAEDVPSIGDAAKDEARRLGFFPTGNVKFTP